MILYLARDANKEIMLTSHKPFKDKFSWRSDGNYILLPKNEFKQVKWEDEEPTKVKLEVV